MGQRLVINITANDTVLANAYFHRQMWSKLGPLLEFCPHDSVNYSIILALYEINAGNSEVAQQTVSQAFKILADKSRSVFKHDKSALYPIFVKAQQLHELNEMITCKREDLKDIWSVRLSRCRRTFDVYNS